ncbi:cysteine-rich receptor-like protein kinase 2 [Amborella trichopoda]|nr:cysteine-rich receptor-like protein kinase 2 [Amborella trichopoda]|eukprot:XP_006845733.3 cysteine-rich receptor-like protein kinase 2 [Amborella trichopoda]
MLPSLKTNTANLTTQQKKTTLFLILYLKSEYRASFIFPYLSLSLPLFTATPSCFQMSSNLSLYLLPILLLLMPLTTRASSLPLTSFQCNGTTLPPPLQKTLNKTLDCLESSTNSSSRGFCIKGKNSKIYGFAQCRGDQNPRNCSLCISEAKTKALSDCNGVSEARVYTENCVLFYQDRKFSGTGNPFPVNGPECGEIQEVPVNFTAKVSSLVAELVAEVDGKKGFGVRGDAVAGVYGLAQCWSVAVDGCRLCMQRAADALLGICLPKVEGKVVYDGCFLKYQNYPLVREALIEQGGAPAGEPGPSSITSKDRDHQKTSAIVLFVGGLILLVLSVTSILCFLKSTKFQDFVKKLRSEKQATAAAAYCFSGNLRMVSYFSYATLKKATDNFKQENMLGCGGFGPVFEGVLDDGQKVAIKKLSLNKSQQGESEFLTEVRLITSIQHKNLVRLLGCCSDGPERLLVYEYMSNGSLDRILYGKSDKFLNWQIRYQIILGIARGLQYLHEDSHFRIVHRDIKASNILLDAKFQPRIGDFGVARFFPEDLSYLSTKFAGTLGYTAPEYAIRGELSEKADIYSFGVLVLEIVSSRKNTDLTLSPDKQYLPEYVWKLHERLRILDLIDPKLKADGFEEKDFMQIIHVALLCLQPDSSLRPPMSEIVAMFTCKSDMLVTPVKPAFMVKRHRQNQTHSWETLSDGFPSIRSESPSFPRHISWGAPRTLEIP